MWNVFLAIESVLESVHVVVICVSISVQVFDQTHMLIRHI